MDHRYLILSGVVVVALAIQTFNQQWSSDMWQHVSVVRELQAHLVDPDHPLLVGSEAHPFYSPYTVAVGALARIAGLSAITALSVAALANLVLFLAALHLAVVALTERPRAPFWALLFTLLLWGIVPWRWSGYLNANSIGFGLPYPSMFAAGVSLLGFTAMIRLCRRPDPLVALGLAACVAVVALTHPLTSGALIIGLLAIALSSKGVRSVPTMLALGGAGMLVVVLVLLWPYYSCSSSSRALTCTTTTPCTSRCRNEPSSASGHCCSSGPPGVGITGTPSSSWPSPPRGRTSLATWPTPSRSAGSSRCLCSPVMRPRRVGSAMPSTAGALGAEPIGEATDEHGASCERSRTALGERR
ncbi:MAG: hypothetical protein WKF43_00160 [Acidimicrobiales bacterium]